MWPWEHVAVGYLCYFVLTRARGRRVGEWSALAVVVGTQFPDLVDKPLTWTLNLLPAGVLVHSLFVAVPLAVVVVLLAHWKHRTDVGLAFGVGLLSHLPADVFPSAVFGGRLRWWPLFWPVTSRPPSAPVADPVVGPGAGDGIVTNAGYYFGNYLDALVGPSGWIYVGFEVVLLGLALTIWLRDGRPGLATVRTLLTRRGSDFSA